MCVLSSRSHSHSHSRLCLCLSKMFCSFDCGVVCVRTCWKRCQTNRHIGSTCKPQWTKYENECGFDHFGLCHICVVVVGLAKSRNWLKFWISMITFSDCDRQTRPVASKLSRKLKVHRVFTWMFTSSACMNANSSSFVYHHFWFREIPRVNTINVIYI